GLRRREGWRAAGHGGARELLESGARPAGDEGAAQDCRALQRACRSSGWQGRVRCGRRCRTHGAREARAQLRSGLRAGRRTATGHAPRRLAPRHARRRSAHQGEGSPMSTDTTSQSANGAIVSAKRVRKTYLRGKEELNVLQDLDLTVHEGAFEALMGPSGSGKSTLLNLIAGLDRPTSGTIEVAGVDVGALPERARAKWRAANIGFIFQTYNMMPVLTALENV